MSIVGRIVDSATVDITNQAEQPISNQVLVQPELADFPDDILFMPAEIELTSRFYYIERLRSVKGEPVFLRN